MVPPVVSTWASSCGSPNGTSVMTRFIRTDWAGGVAGAGCLARISSAAFSQSSLKNANGIGLQSLVAQVEPSCGCRYVTGPGVACPIVTAPVLHGAEAFSAPGGPDGVLVLHGFTGSPFSMRPLADKLAEAGYAVELPRLPGHGT